MKILIIQLFIIRVADHRFKLEQEIGTESPHAGLFLFRSGPIPCLFSLVETGLKPTANLIRVEFYSALNICHKNVEVQKVSAELFVTSLAKAESVKAGCVLI